MKTRIPKLKRLSYNPKIVTAFFAEHGIHAPIFEYKFCYERKWCFDVAWPAISGSERVNGFDGNLAIEVQGGLFRGGAHVRGAALVKEYEKLNKAACMGWRVIFVQPHELCMSSTVLMIKEAFGWL